jgi:hypothetical protein
MFEAQSNETLQNWIRIFEERLKEFKSATVKKQLDDTRRIIQRRR